MWRLALVGAIVSACAARKSEPLADGAWPKRPAEVAVPVRQALAPIDLRGLAHVGPADPERKPYLATVRYQWPAICAARGRLSDDVLRYVEAWCQPGQPQLWSALTAARDSAQPQLADAALHDVAAMIAANSGEGAAREMFEFAGNQVAAFELLAHAFLARGRDDQARRLIAEVHLRLPIAACELAVSDLLAQFAPSTYARLIELDHTCHTQVEPVMCALAPAVPIAGSFCTTPEPAADDPDARIAALVVGWGPPWLALADRAAEVADPRATQLAVVALQNALAESCDSDTRAHATRTATVLRARDPVLAACPATGT